MTSQTITSEKQPQVEDEIKDDFTVTSRKRPRTNQRETPPAKKIKDDEEVTVTSRKRTRTNQRETPPAKKRYKKKCPLPGCPSKPQVRLGNHITKKQKKAAFDNAIRYVEPSSNSWGGSARQASLEDSFFGVAQSLEWLRKRKRRRNFHLPTYSSQNHS